MGNYLNLTKNSTTRSLTKIQADNGARSGVFYSGQAVAHEDTFRCDTVSAGIKLSLSALRAATIPNASILRGS